uniref:Uncharacterized protein n=1 Tax=Oryza sativa subsp. japonica TaxID=39947 RepID=Q6ZL67_ORYSJ|nr:hypothetical protein [Oryza sativa Japonica Group]
MTKWGDGGALDTGNADERTTKDWYLVASGKIGSFSCARRSGGGRSAPASSMWRRWRAWDLAGGGSPYTDPAAVAVNARIQRWWPSPHGSGSRPPSPRAGSSSAPLPFLPSLDPAEGRGVGGVAAGGERGSDGGWRGGQREAGGTVAIGWKPTAGF